MPHPSYDKAVRDGQKKDKSLRQKVTDWIAPYEKATSDFFGNPLENLEKNYKPKSRLKNSKTGTLTGTMADKINPKKSKKRR